MSTIVVRTADHSQHALLYKVAKQHKHTRDFSNRIFSGADCYEAGRIRVASSDDEVLGFTCFRNRIRDKWTVLYFIAVDTQHFNKGVGRLLMEDLFVLSEAGVELKVVKTNPAVDFYIKLGYKKVGEAFKGTAWLMRKAKAQ